MKRSRVKTIVHDCLLYEAFSQLILSVVIGMNWRTMAHPYRYNGIANRLAVQLAVIVVALLFLNEFLIYYLQIAQVGLKCSNASMFRN